MVPSTTEKLQVKSFSLVRQLCLHLSTICKTGRKEQLNFLAIFLLLGLENNQILPLFSYVATLKKKEENSQKYHTTVKNDLLVNSLY